MEGYFHSVGLVEELCRGCTNCVRRCPTEAIRVRNGKALIIKDRCIDCGECIRICPHSAKQAVVSKLDSLDSFKYKIALPAPSLYAQFNNLGSPNIVLSALKKFGFDMVYEVSQAAEIITQSTKMILKENTAKKPILSSACPAVLRLISVRFPELIDNILPLKAPVALAAINAREIAKKTTGLSDNEIGVAFITPCPAKVTEIKSPLLDNQILIDEVMSISDIYPKLLSLMDTADMHSHLSASGSVGVGWASSGGECYGLDTDSYLAADGIENVIGVLEGLEDEKMRNLNFVELNACPGGCVGGVLTIENPFIARTKLVNLRKKLPYNKNYIDDTLPVAAKADMSIQYSPAMRLDENFVEASKKLKRLREIEAGLYGLDCGSCGAPSCRCLAEDIVRGYATEEYCVYKMAELASDSDNPINPLPIAFRTKEPRTIPPIRKSGERKDDW